MNCDRDAVMGKLISEPTTAESPWLFMKHMAHHWSTSTSVFCAKPGISSDPRSAGNAAIPTVQLPQAQAPPTPACKNGPVCGTYLKPDSNRQFSMPENCCSIPAACCVRLPAHRPRIHCWCACTRLLVRGPSIWAPSGITHHQSMDLPPTHPSRASPINSNLCWQSVNRGMTDYSSIRIRAI